MACAAAATAPTIREADDRFRLLRMECECERPRKRPKLSGWDVPFNPNANSNEKDLIMQHVDKSASVFIDLLKGLLKFEPSERMKAREALRHPFFTGSNKS